MAKDNRIDKEFYDLSKKMFDHVQRINARTKTMTEEDEAFEEVERKLWAERKAKIDTARKASDGVGYLSVIEEAEYKSMQFVTEYNGEEIGQMSIRKAYEIGYRAAMYAAEGKKNGN